MLEAPNLKKQLAVDKLRVVHNTARTPSAGKMQKYRYVAIMRSSANEKACIMQAECFKFHMLQQVSLIEIDRSPVVCKGLFHVGPIEIELLDKLVQKRLPYQVLLCKEIA